jgi:hypothetical protein
MLNTHAAVLEAATPSARMGLFRTLTERGSVRFATSTSEFFDGTVLPGAFSTNEISIPSNTVQANISIGWGGILSPNDLGLKVFDARQTLLGESNYLNVPFLNGRREKVAIKNPPTGTLQARINHTFSNGTVQYYSGVVEITQIEYRPLRDLNELSAENQSIVLESLSRFLLSSEGSKFKPTAKVLRSDLAEMLVRSGLVPQYLAPQPLYADVRDISTRNIVESVQASPFGKLIPDTTNNNRFNLYEPATKLITAVALVKANGLENQAQTATLPPSVTDALTIPSAYRGYVAIALQKGWLTLDGNNFNPNRAVTRLEAAKAFVLIARSVE